MSKHFFVQLEEQKIAFVKRENCKLNWSYFSKIFQPELKWGIKK